MVSLIRAYKAVGEGLTFNLRQETHAVIFRDISGIFLSPKDSRSVIAADRGDMLEYYVIGERVLQVKVNCNLEIGFSVPRLTRLWSEEGASRM